MARLKVFTWSDGFHAFTVAASSRPKALKAWGMSQDIFKSGLAREITDGPAFDAAQAQPGEVIQTGEAIDPGEISKAPRRGPDSGPTPAQKARVADLEERLERLDAKQATEMGNIAAEVAALQKQRSVLEGNYEAARRDLVARLKAARASR
ncbi:hypothetical protein KOAAANKH_01884 [Brevundimonas sp. NIBR10]|uniref:hypothetical protein n=1 Tax=Brevundimonas sp. NIBR10 TaxID=3015997 RepID=UPI0022F16DA3|nr:hypothetical protein [Brevundimonas sp. NIBR10]WGM47010.1 hypothetical protein KOAAANKH_01884 [Brevundimonas sp. NIBR10]